MATTIFTLELTSSISPAKLFKANVLEAHKFGPLALPAIVASAAIIKGDGGVGSIRQVNFTDAIPWNSVKELLEMLDNDKLECKLALVDGAGMGEKLEGSTCHIKVEPSADGGSVYKVCSEIKILSGFEFGDAEIGESKKGMTNMFKAIEAYVIANPCCV